MKTTKEAPKPPVKISMPVRVAEEPEARREWCRVLAFIGDKLDNRDINLLEDYCMTYAEILTLHMVVEMEGRVLMGAKGGSYMNPMLTVLMNRQGHLAALRRDLYFTPKSRIEKQTKATMSKAKSIRHQVEEDDGSED